MISVYTPRIWKDRMPGSYFMRSNCKNQPVDVTGFDSVKLLAEEI